jgi:2-polyprenyl-3-methyl-5-hydroxy-6-metoxy-1,4-benzoquinol methylase
VESVNWLAQMEARRLVLSLREMLVRFDENIAANTLMAECVPYILQGDPEIARARSQQALKVAHITGDVDEYAGYYATNAHERPFEEQHQTSAADAHLFLHRVAFLRDWLSQQVGPRAFGDGAACRLLDVACNDGWMAANLHAAFPQLTYRGVDLNPDCIRRAQGREVPGADFSVDRAEDVLRMRPRHAFDVVVAYELVEHVRDPEEVLHAMVAACKPGGSLFISTPLGACTDGDLPEWWVLEPAGHVRAYTTQSFAALLARYGTVDGIHISDAGAGAGQLMVARVTTPG